MSATKKLIPLSLSVSDFLSHYPPNTTGLTYAFPAIAVQGKSNISFQLIYQDLNNSTAKLSFEQSLDNINFDAIANSAGLPVLVDLSNHNNSVTINLYNINTAFLRCVLILNSLTAGSFTNYIYLTN